MYIDISEHKLAISLISEDDLKSDLGLGFEDLLEYQDLSRMPRGLREAFIKLIRESFEGYIRDLDNELEEVSDAPFVQIESKRV